jgi:RNA polymerase sigma-70 factor (ECF subfamily)
MRCARGESQALAELYTDAAPQLFAVLVRILVRRDLAEEALQEVFVSIWRNADRYRSEAAQPMTWMISIARYRAIDMKRRLRRELPLDAAGAMAEPVDTSADPLADAVRADERSALDVCMDELKADPRECVRLAYLKGLTHDEVAATVKSPLGTVKSWIRRGLKALKECLER